MLPVQGRGGGGMNLMSLIHGQETRISHVAQPGQKKKWMQK